MAQIVRANGDGAEGQILLVHTAADQYPKAFSFQRVAGSRCPLRASKKGGVSWAHALFTLWHVGVDLDRAGLDAAPDCPANVGQSISPVKRPRPVNFTLRRDGRMSGRFTGHRAAFWPGLQIAPVAAKLPDCEELSPACQRQDEASSVVDVPSTERRLRRFFSP